MTLYKNKYRIESSRLKEYDYSQSGYYFIIICTFNRMIYFGNVNNNGKMILNNNGLIVKNVWMETPKIRKNVFLDEWIIMPNHFYAIVVVSISGIRSAI